MCFKDLVASPSYLNLLECMQLYNTKLYYIPWQFWLKIQALANTVLGLLEFISLRIS